MNIANLYFKVCALPLLAGAFIAGPLSASDEVDLGICCGNRKQSCESSNENKCKTVTFNFSVTGETDDPSATFVAFVQDLKSTKILEISPSIPLTTGSGSTTLTVKIPNDNDPVLFGIKLFTPNGIDSTTTSPSVTVTTCSRTTIYDLSPTSNTIEVEAGTTAVYEITLPKRIL